MVEKKTRKKKTADAETKQILPLQDDRKRFGAVAFFDNRTENDGDDEVVLSFDSLREAFAAVDRERVDEPENLAHEAVEEPSEEFDESVDTNEEEGVFDLNPRIILEAMLFVGNRENKPLTSQQAAEQMRNVTPEEIDAAVLELNRMYHHFSCPYHIVAERGGYRMVVRPEFEAIREKFYGKVREATLSQQEIDTLAIVVHRQPISAEDVQKLWKQPCVSTLSRLERRGLLTTERESCGKKKVVVYRTTPRFLELFDLASLDDLPLSDETD